MKTCTLGRLAFAKENNRGLEKIPRHDEPAEYSRLSLLVNYFSLFFIAFAFCKIILACQFTRICQLCGLQLEPKM